MTWIYEIVGNTRYVGRQNAGGRHGLPRLPPGGRLEEEGRQLRSVRPYLHLKTDLSTSIRSSLSVDVMLRTAWITLLGTTSSFDQYACL